MVSLNKNLVTYYLRIFETFSLFDAGELEVRDELLAELDELWLSMTVEERAASKALAKKARREYDMLKRYGAPSGMRKLDGGSALSAPGEADPSRYARGANVGRGRIRGRRSHADADTSRSFFVGNLRHGKGGK